MSALRIAQGAFFLATLFISMTAHGAPRSPGPPIPDGTPLYYEGFDEDYFFGETNVELIIAGLGTLDQSWSGYALNRSGSEVAPFVIPALSSDGETNISSDVGGALRWWIAPSWTSESGTGGSGPGATATLLQFDAADAGETAYVWSLDVSSNGNTLALHVTTDGGIGTALSLPITWQAGAWHCLALDYYSNATALFIDGSLVASGGGLPSIPTSFGELVFGSRSPD